MRICGYDSALATRLNEERVNYTDEEIESTYEEIVNKIERKMKKQQVEVVVSKIGSYK
jgi:hypothetical protein